MMVATKLSGLDRERFVAIVGDRDRRADHPIDHTRLRSILSSTHPRPGTQRTIRSYDLVAASSIAPRCKRAPFKWSPTNAQRRVGLVALSIWQEGSAGSIAEGVDAVLGQEASMNRLGPGGSGSLVEWLGSLTPLARGFVAIRSTTWAQNLAAAVRWDRSVRIDPPVRWWVDEQSGLRLRAHSDLSIHHGDALSVVQMVGGRPSEVSAIALCFDALVHYLDHDQRLGAITVAGWWPEVGRGMVIKPDQTLLEETARRVAACASVASPRTLRAVA